MELSLIQGVTSWLSDDPIARGVLAVLLTVWSIAIVIAIVFAGLRPLLHLIRDRWAIDDEWFRLALRIARWVIGVGVAVVPISPVQELPWIALIAVGLVAAEWSESVWSWAKTLARLAGKRIRSLVSGDLS